ncbi:DUF3244 domain-containing protein [Dyadobacter sp. 3J3]|uniref:DUF3244 domain-containing protein n=1 Tax=Dyadobacter sp. 3J3 TaxID=2606600 RepID=UPI00135CB620|nr:hypothetical protein [Dyadobacter sp. 3J3]
MRKSIKNILVAFVAVTSLAFTANAEGRDNTKTSDLNTGVFVNKEGKINVTVDQANVDAATTISIINEIGEVVYSEVVERGNQKFGRVLNVDKLEDGQYEIEVKSKNESQTKTFQVSEPKTERVIEIQ